MSENLESERLIDPAPPTPRHYLRKAYFFDQLLNSGDLPADSDWRNEMANAQMIVYNHHNQYPDDSELRQSIAAQMSRKHIDPFEVEKTASGLAETLFRDTQPSDMFDFMLGVRSYGILASETLVETNRLDEESLERSGVLRRAFIDEAIKYVHPAKLYGEAILNLNALYKRVFKNRDHNSVQELSSTYLQEAQLRVRDHLTLNEMILQAKWFGSEIKLKDDFTPNIYNRPMTDQERSDLNNESAEAIEKLHLLKAYPVAPIVVPNHTVGLPWDILIMPPLNKKLEAYDEGCVATFYLTNPVEHEEAQLSLEPTADPGLSRMMLGNELPIMRFQLHDDGQISFGRLIDNVPNHTMEHIFNYTGSHDGYARLRALFISLAFDALAPDDVVRDRVGGSVASYLPRHMNRSDGGDPFLKIVLNRVRELNRQKISSRNRRPLDWQEPIKHVGGYRRALPEGTRARPTAEAEARDYFASIKVKFDGLAPNENFVSGYKRGAGPEKVTFRRADFRSSARTSKFLLKHSMKEK